MVTVYVYITKEDYQKDEGLKHIESWMKKTMGFYVIHNTKTPLPQRGILLIDFRLPKDELFALIKRVDESKKEQTRTSPVISIPQEIVDTFHLEKNQSITYKDLRAKYGLPHLHYAHFNVEPGYKDAGHITNSYGLGLWGLSKMGKL